LGETLNGDRVVLRTADERSLLAVIDGLGHGPAAAAAAQRASLHLESVPLEMDLKQVVQGLHSQLRGTRGAAAMVCSLSGGRLEGCGVGNVELRVQGGSLPVVLSPGILGSNVRAFRIFCGELHMGSRLALFSDGVSSRFSLQGVRQLTPAEACALILERHGYSHDDATVLIADIDR
jgi:negative regulator of sigma-B (phosphoserine phosphatase)